MNISYVQGHETSVDIKSYLNYKKVFLIYNIIPPVNEYIMELMFVCDALRKEGAEKIYLITSYMPYTKIKYKTEYKLNFNLFSRLLENINIDKIYTFGLYSPKISFYFKIPLYNIPITNIFSKILNDNFKENKNLIISTIDYEMQEISTEIANKLKTETIFPIKEEINGNINFQIKGNVNNKDILIISDSIYSGKNIINYSKFLTFKGAKDIYAIVTHGIFDKKAISLINNSVIKEIYSISNYYEKTKKIKIISITNIIEEIIKRNIEKKNLKHILK
ncbi:MAG: ribose-phosphate diphosphokinase, partial [Candidatus ainarchaeum sp.]|nr:ribose-phosphate diphosphokinase [Candidatus ainarchaeum sp.]